MKLLRGLLRALLPVLSLLLAAELVLWLAGLDGPPLGDAGFAGGRLIVPDEHEAGAWQTQLFNGTRREQRIPPRDARRRVLLFGGSNTQYFPENALDFGLEQAAPGEIVDPETGSDAWEVINLGREGYGSQRVVRLVQAAMRLKPDVVVIYSGHNEFVERALELEARQQRGGLGELLVTLLGKLRSARVLSAALRTEAAPDDGERAQLAGGGVGADPSLDLLASLDFSDTLRHRERYRRNLEAMIDAAQAAGAHVIVCTVARNMLVPPRTYRVPPELGPADVERLQLLRRRALDAIPSRFREHLRPYEGVWVRSWFGGHEGAPDAQPAPQRRLLGDAVSAPALSGPKSGSVAGAHWPDPAGWTPEVFALLNTTSQLLARDPSPTERAALIESRALLDECLALAPTEALLQYDRGLVAFLLGEPDGVRRIDLSIDADHGPRTTTPAQNAIVRALAAERTLPLLDADAAFRARSPDGLIGFELLMDHCHLQPGARVLLMQDMVAAIVALPW